MSWFLEVNESSYKSESQCMCVVRLLLLFNRWLSEFKIAEKIIIWYMCANYYFRNNLTQITQGQLFTFFQTLWMSIEHKFRITSHYTSVSPFMLKCWKILSVPLRTLGCVLCYHGGTFSSNYIDNLLFLIIISCSVLQVHFYWNLRLPFRYWRIWNLSFWCLFCEQRKLLLK